MGPNVPQIVGCFSHVGPIVVGVGYGYGWPWSGRIAYFWWLALVGLGLGCGISPRFHNSTHCE